MIGKHESGQCNHCGLPETVEQVLIRAYEREIIQLKEELNLLPLIHDITECVKQFS